MAPAARTRPLYVSHITKAKLDTYYKLNQENIENEGYTSFDDWTNGLVLEAYYGYWEQLPSARANELRRSNGSET